ncbi:ABC-F type ribosomal protection protein [Fictibacillus sp. Mic-4]|uniref:ribosomal protection-like ABC-F family protein n=1 Tax=Fictibacillus sp. Mic-4 TaxID=3132826 RepID=UPI003CF35157
MMLILKAERLSKELNGNLLFKNANIEVFEGEHIAIIGKNGVGKTTLLKILKGEVEKDSGTIYSKVPASQWGMLEQQTGQEEMCTLLEYVKKGHRYLYEIKNELEQLQNRMAKQEETFFDQIMNRYSELQEQYILNGGYEWELEIEKCLTKLKFKPQDWETPYERLSGGQKTKAQLARILIGKPKLIILDEPTNHLDTETMGWLEEWMNHFKGTVIYVSHDRRFLDRTAHKTYELTNEGTKVYKGGYSEYRRQKDIEEQTQMAVYKKQQQERKLLLEAIQRYRQWFNSAHHAASVRDPGAKKKAMKNITRAQAKEKELERLDKESVTKVKKDPSLQVKFEESFEARTLLRAMNISFSYGENNIVRQLHLIVNRGDRIAVVGSNGAGKTTFLRLLTGKLLPGEGKIVHHPQLKIGYFAQELEDLDFSKTILDTFLSLPDMTESKARTILACFLFRKDDVYKRIADLSMGEKCRVALVKLYFSDANLLVLDEPTNYLDIETRERLEEAFIDYPGAMLIVSHDRYLLQKVANRVIRLNEGEVEIFQEPYKDFFERMENSHHPVDSLVANQIKKLELDLINSIAEEQGSEAVEAERLKRIQTIKREIARLKGE